MRIPIYLMICNHAFCNYPRKEFKFDCQLLGIQINTKACYVILSCISKLTNEENLTV